ncbi:MAG: hypothetical protein HY363_02175 [Candidatus Aenigmarchaeota archaeon]|nr:hypothetical protein [Candidatus Aenigmarchaeota archaeon]
MRSKYIIAVMLLLILFSCTKSESEALELKSPFIGGNTGLAIAFQGLRKDVFDGGRDPFDVLIRLENKGETAVKKEDVSLKLSGINPAEFSKLEEQLVKNPDDDILESRLDPAGQVLLAPPSIVEFTGLNHFAPITGASANFPLRAEVCYVYTTKAVSKVCVRSNLLNPPEEGICAINEAKPVFNSGAPIQIENVQESARAKDKIGFSFEIKHAGTGQLFEKKTKCDRTQRKNENRAYIVVDSKMSGVTCTGLTSSGTKAEGFVTLFDGVKLVTCTQPITTKSDYEQVISIEATYDYQEFSQTEITVKSSGENQQTS